MELGPQGVHTLLVAPGPIARDDSGSRYAEQSAGLPPAAGRPGAGARLRLIPPDELASKILTACERRRSELVIPAKTKFLFALAQLWPAFADWVLQKKTSDD
jgi:short-subunit dehydrogenase